MDEYIAVYLTDIKMAIEELESYFNGYPMRYDVFVSDYLRLRSPKFVKAGVAALRRF